MFLGDTMYEVSINIIKKINKLGYEAYIVGGYPRDQYLGITNIDIDLCSNISEDKLFNNFDIVSKNHFGSFVILENNYKFKIKFKNERKPII